VLLPCCSCNLLSFHQWTVYLGTWWDAEFVVSNCSGGVDRSALRLGRGAFAGVRDRSTVGCFVVGFALAYLMYKPFASGVLLHHLHSADAERPGRRRYTAEMMLYQSGPINDVITRLSGIEFKPHG